jgi:hypothetical protein
VIVSRRGFVAFRFVLFSLPLIALLVGVELSTYWVMPSANSRIEGDPIIAYDGEIGFVPERSGRSRRVYLGEAGRTTLAYHLFTDPRGARVSRPEEAIAERPDVVAIGCSFTWGHGVENEETFAARLGHELGVSVSNLAMGSYGTVQSLQMLRRNRDLAPTLVIYAIVTDHLRRNVVPCAPSYHPFCLDYSHVTWGRDNRPMIAQPAGNGVRRAQLQAIAETTGLDPVTRFVHGMDVVRGRLTLQWGRTYEADAGKQEEALDFLLAQLVDTVQSMAARLLLVFIPTANAPPPAVLPRLVAERGVRFLDMTSDFVREHKNPATSPLYIPGDGHPSMAGHALIARRIADLVRAEQLLAPQR